MDIPVEIPITREEYFGATRSSISDTTSLYVTANRPERTAALETTPKFSIVSQNPPFHTCMSSAWDDAFGFWFVSFTYAA